MRYSESEDYMDFVAKFGHSNNAKVADVLWLCTSVMSMIKIRSLQICWFTDKSTPHTKGSNLFKETCTKAEELSYLIPDFRIIPLETGFDFDAFYLPFMSRIMGRDEDEITLPKEINLSDNTKVETLVGQLLRQDYTHRALSYISMEISEKVKFGVGVYNFTRKKTEPTSVKLDRVTNQPIEFKRQYKYAKLPEEDENDIDLERSVMLSEILTADKTIKYLEVGNEKVKFTPLEVYETRQVMQPKIKLLGFKPLSAFKSDMHLKNPYFIYPSDRFIKGSTSIFRALWETCLRNEKFALCIFTMRLKSFPRVVALIPQEEDNSLNTYDGFRLEFLPYASDIRELSQTYCKEEVLKETDEGLVNAVTSMIGKCAISYSTSMIKNPVNEKIYNAIESSVFNEEKSTAEDNSKPNVEAQDARIAKYVAEIKEYVGDFEEALAAKRKATAASEGGSKPKKAALDINFEMILEKCKAGEAKNITVPFLKEYLKEKNVSGLSKMTKEDLIAKIVELN
jgi:ATP-dependent DNA helicase 2 subunit 1